MHDLVLLDVDFTRADLGTVHFPTLRALTFYPKRGQLHSFLQQLDLPTLKALAVPAVRQDLTPNNLAIQKAPSLLFLQTDATLLGPSVGLGAAPRRYPVLISFELSQALDQLDSYSDSEHFQLVCSGTDSRGPHMTSQSYEQELETLVAFVETAPALRSFSLPHEFHPSTPLEPDRASRRKKLLEVLERRKIHIVWRLNSKEWSDDLAVNGEFWRYAKQLRMEGSI
ncbi:hypothetical protein JCM8097_005701 [Rhodosporidiobolus ruineniae]